MRIFMPLFVIIDDEGDEEDIVNVYHGCHDLGCRGTKQAETV